MLVQKVSTFPDELGANVKFFNPFGPNILHYTLQPDILKKCLDCINDYRGNREVIEKLKSEGQIVQGSRAIENQSNSIIDGEMLTLDQEFQEKYYDNIFKDVISVSCYNYGLQSAMASIDDIGMREVEDDYFASIEHNVESMEVEIKDCWFVALKEGDFHILHEHNHGGVLLSGGIYLDVPDKPWPQGNMNWIVNGNSASMFNASWGVQPKAGDVFVWPSWIKHSVYPFKGEGERLMVSFNSILTIIKDGNESV
ncbi:uncharacterized protein METZ01_LOCUS211056 [marine metagenome]|uniref:Prolyl 4-hydroxylase alpha subunit Fe(2+) 2OG dioxygenase domain-containing protein n=1 Tax=marine metagenome TaxID=408172 RepID=A0A382F6E5_9ZZZZ